MTGEKQGDQIPHWQLMKSHPRQLSEDRRDSTSPLKARHAMLSPVEQLQSPVRVTDYILSMRAK